MDYNYWHRNGKPLHMVKCKLGKYYYIHRGGKLIIGRFIKVTPKGYNFLDETINKCIFPKHWYIPRKWVDQCQGDDKIFLEPTHYEAIPVEG
jgi:hypothetical protein